MFRIITLKKDPYFEGYYEEGDFIPQYRYSIRGHRYAIPYNGEELKLYWVNSVQYYTKICK
ncbi:MAG: hypothetical protein ABIL76_05130 [candidate division WOR-3 bacterium]